MAPPSLKTAYLVYHMMFFGTKYVLQFDLAKHLLFYPCLPNILGLTLTSLLSKPNVTASPHPLSKQLTLLTT